MVWDSARWQQLYHEKSHPQCPHCGSEIDMNDSEYASGHTTYWGEDGPKENECPSCYKPIFIAESVDRSWTVGKKAEDLD